MDELAYRPDQGRELRNRAYLSSLFLEGCELVDGGSEVVLSERSVSDIPERVVMARRLAYLGQLLSLGDLLVSFLAEVLLGLESGVRHDD